MLVKITENNMSNKYKKPVGDRTHIDVYDVCDIFGVNDTSGAIHHAIKKLLCNGERGYKPAIQDYREAIGSIQRKIELMEANKDPIKRAVENSRKRFHIKDPSISPTPPTPPRTPVIGEDVSFDSESRIENIGPNGNDGEHYPQNGKPNWDDAPDDATHLDPYGVSVKWYKLSGSEWFYIGFDGRWKKSRESGHFFGALEARPQ